MRDLPIKLPANTGLSKLVLSPDFSNYSPELQRVVVYIMTHKQLDESGHSYSGWDMLRRYTTGSVEQLVVDLDAIAAEMLRTEVSEDKSYINRIDIAGQVIGNSAKINITVEFLDGTTEEGQFTINE